MRRRAARLAAPWAVVQILRHLATRALHLSGQANLNHGEPAMRRTNTHTFTKLSDLTNDLVLKAFFERGEDRGAAPVPVSLPPSPVLPNGEALVMEDA